MEVVGNVDDPGQGLGVEEMDAEEWMHSGQTRAEEMTELERLVGETNYRDVLNLATIHQKTRASGPDSSLVALEEEERDLLQAAQEDQDGQVLLTNTATRSPLEPIPLLETNVPEQQVLVPRPPPSPEPGFLCQILVKHKRKTITCGERLESYEALLDHEEEIHRMKKALVCRPCQQRFFLVKDIQAHSLECPFNQKCLHCELRYETLKALRIHMEARHKNETKNLSAQEYRALNGDRICPHCHKMLARPAILKRHLELGKCVPRVASPVQQVQDPLVPATVSEVRHLRQTRGLGRVLEPLGAPPRDGIGNVVNLPQKPLQPESFDIVYPNAQTKEQVLAGCGSGGGNVSVTIPLTMLTEDEIAEGGFCLAYRCGLCHFVVVSDVGALIYHQLSCKRIDLRPFDKTEFMQQNRCFLCGWRAPSFGEFCQHYDKCRKEKFDPDSFEWFGPSPPKAVRVPRSL